MKKIILIASSILMFTLSSASMASMSYECWAYVGGHPDKMVHVTANSGSEAESLAWAKFKDLSIKVESVNCK
ncbi:MAG: hypothetical protein HOP02_09475 [Methylococcaceae bacterium]|nr:hypothetical protein [Methylococcaceae bacterium]